MHTESGVAEWTLDMSKTFAELIIKLLSSASKNLITALLAALSNPQQQPGLMKIMELSQRGDNLQIIRLSKEQYSDFAKKAAQYGLFFSAAKQKDGSMDIIFGDSQVAILNHVLSELGLGEVEKNTEAPTQSSEKSSELSALENTEVERGFGKEVCSTVIIGNTEKETDKIIASLEKDILEKKSSVVEKVEKIAQKQKAAVEIATPKPQKIKTGAER